MARETPNPKNTESSDKAHVSASGESQLQSASGEPEQKQQTPEKAAKKNDETQFFDTTIAKVVTDEDGNEVVVMSDFLEPGEKLKRALDEEKAAEKSKASRKAAEDAAQDRK